MDNELDQRTLLMEFEISVEEEEPDSEEDGSDSDASFPFPSFFSPSRLDGPSSSSIISVEWTEISSYLAKQLDHEKSKRQAKWIWCCCDLIMLKSVDNVARRKCRSSSAISRIGNAASSAQCTRMNRNNTGERSSPLDFPSEVAMIRSTKVNILEFF